jgi:hypothetical protein
MPEIIEIRGLEEVIKKLDAYPQELNAAMQATTEAALLTLQENVPPYPAPPENSSYRRTGTLGRTLGSGVSGGATGKPEIFEVRKLGSGWEGTFGTRLEYAPYVIGDDTQAQHMGHWWTISKVAEKAKDKIERMFQTMADKLKEFLDLHNG